MHVTVIFVQHTRTIETHTKDYIFGTPVAEAIPISKPKGFANVARMLTLILKHHLLMEKLEPDALSTPFPGQVLKKSFQKATYLFPQRSCHHQALLDTSAEQQIYPSNKRRKAKSTPTFLSSRSSSSKVKH